VARRLILQGMRVVTPLQEIKDGVVLIEGEKIAWVGPKEKIPPVENAERINLGENIIAPGFIDIHIHGYGGMTVFESPEALRDVAHRLIRSGTTSFLPTFCGICGFEKLIAKLKQVREAEVLGHGANILGIHMEGPFLSHEEPAIGAQSRESLRTPSVSELEQMQAAADGAIRYMTIAPELAGALHVIKEMNRLGIVPSAGHSNASYEEVCLAVDAGLRSVCHLYNGMPPMHHRKPGLVGAALTMPELNVELIGDGLHVGKTAMEILFKCKSKDKITLISDNTKITGLPDGSYQREDGSIRIKRGSQSMTEKGRLSGSVMPMNEIVRNVIENTECSISEAVRMASLNPAILFGIDDRKGSIEKGKDADLISFDQDLNLKLAMVGGKILFHQTESA
jgi:N-acetylglucosamine-6-phosphate deacetylase